MTNLHCVIPLVSDNPENMLEQRPEGLFIGGRWESAQIESGDPRIVVDVQIEEGRRVKRLSLNMGNPLVVGELVDGRILVSNPRTIYVLDEEILVVNIPIQTEFEGPEEVYLFRGPDPVSITWDFGVTVDGVTGPSDRSFSVGNTTHLIRVSDQNWITVNKV